MSDAPRPQEPEPAYSDDELRRIALPAHVRRAPRFGRVIGTGVAVGFVAGALCGLLLPNSSGAGRGTAALFIGLGFALLGATVTALIAVGLDRGTPRYLKNAGAPAWTAEEGASAARPHRASAGRDEDLPGDAAPNEGSR